MKREKGKVPFFLPPSPYIKLTGYTMITIALSKGRIFEETLPLLAAAGITALEDPETSRKLILDTNRADVRLIIVRASDVPTYVQYGAADIGVAGKDVLNEHGGQGLYQPNQRSSKAHVCAWRPSTSKQHATISPPRACIST